MINYLLCIVWPILIGGVIGAYKLGKNVGSNGAPYLYPLIFVAIYLFLMATVGGEDWWQFFIVLYFDF